MTTQMTTTLEQLRISSIDEMAATISALNPADYQHMELIAVAEDGDILDGYHRAAGLVAWALENDVEPDALVVPVVVYESTCEAFDLLLEMGPGEDREQALGLLYQG